MPNILGGIGITSDVQAVGSGALIGTLAEIGDFSRLSTTTQKTNGLQFNASKSSSIYGAANTVQPPALCLIPQIKY